VRLLHRVIIDATGRTRALARRLEKKMDDRIRTKTENKIEDLKLKQPKEPAAGW